MTTTRKVLLGIGGLILAGLILALSILAGAFDTTVVSSEVERPLTDGEMKQLAGRGAYVAKVADCYACHTAKGGAPWAGGMAFHTPFGTVYASNISPDKADGIGSWTRAEFHRAIRDGIGKVGRHLYPAMPYSSYRQMSQADVDAVYAYLMTRDPVRVEAPKNKLAFPFNIRQSLAFWNLINLRRDGFETDPARSAVWNRGRYIVDALAHCGECHTPRNVLQGMKTGSYLKGTVIEGIEAPDISRDGLSGMGFNPITLARFMKTGLSAQGAMDNQMFEVVHFSTQYMHEDDLEAMASYLFNLDEMPDASPPPPSTKPVSVSPKVASSAQTTYANLCAGCHGAKGQGIPHVSVPLQSNITPRLASPRNLIHAILHGIPAQQFPGQERMEPMPSFSDMLDDKAVADLANWMRAHWGGRPPDVSPKDVAKLR